MERRRTRSPNPHASSRGRSRRWAQGAKLQRQRQELVEQDGPGRRLPRSAVAVRLQRGGALRGEPTLQPAAPNDLEEIRRLLDESGLPSVDVSEHLAGFLVAREGRDLAGIVGVEP